VCGDHTGAVTSRLLCGTRNPRGKGRHAIVTAVLLDKTRNSNGVKVWSKNAVPGSSLVTNDLHAEEARG
jgi:hypothetical protein